MTNPELKQLWHKYYRWIQWASFDSDIFVIGYSYILKYLKTHNRFIDYYMDKIVTTVHFFIFKAWIKKKYRQLYTLLNHLQLYPISKQYKYLKKHHKSFLNYLITDVFIHMFNLDKKSESV